MEKQCNSINIQTFKMVIDHQLESEIRKRIHDWIMRRIVFSAMPVSYSSEVRLAQNEELNEEFQCSIEIQTMGQKFRGYGDGISVYGSIMGALKALSDEITRSEEVCGVELLTDIANLNRSVEWERQWLLNRV